MKQPIPNKKNQYYSRKEISRTRKFLIWILIICFWIFYYWFQGKKHQSRSQKSAQDILVKKESPIPSINALGSEKPKSKQTTTLKTN